MQINLYIKADKEWTVQDAMRSPIDGVSKLETFRENLSGFWSRRIDESNQFVYTIDGDDLAIYCVSVSQ